MGLTKQYLRYAPSGTFNVIASADCNSAHVSLNGISGRYMAVGACEHVVIWDMRLGEKVRLERCSKLSCEHLSLHCSTVYGKYFVVTAFKPSNFILYPYCLLLLWYLFLRRKCFREKT